MLDSDNPKATNSFDIFVRGQEIVTGGQRIHDATALKENMERLGVDPAGIGDYMDGFGWAVTPHAGCGIGLERFVMLLLNLKDIRHASLFPRDPKSLPSKPQAIKLPHPEASTLPQSRLRRRT